MRRMRVSGLKMRSHIQKTNCSVADMPFYSINAALFCDRSAFLLDGGLLSALSDRSLHGWPRRLQRRSRRRRARCLAERRFRRRRTNVTSHDFAEFQAESFETSFQLFQRTKTYYTVVSPFIGSVHYIKAHFIVSWCGHAGVRVVQIFVQSDFPVDRRD